MTEQEKPRIGQFTITCINNGWLIRWDSMEVGWEGRLITIPNLEYCLTIEDAFALIRTMDPTREEPKVKLATTMPGKSPAKPDN